MQGSITLGGRITYASCKQGGDCWPYLVHYSETGSGSAASHSGESLSKSWRRYKNELQNNTIKIVKTTEFFMD